MSADPLNGRHLLVVEDEYLIASDLAATLEGAGARIYGPVSDVERAIEIIEQPELDLDGAILDINLGGDMVYPAAAMLRERGVPFVFVTGYDCSSMPEDFSRVPCLRKPFEEKELIDAVARLQAGAVLSR